MMTKSGDKRPTTDKMENNNESAVCNDLPHLYAIETRGKTKKAARSSPISGTNSDVGGMLSAISSMKMLYERKTVMPSVIFSPASGGRQKASRLRTFSQTHGMMMLRM